MSDSVETGEVGTAIGLQNAAGRPTVVVTAPFDESVLHELAGVAEVTVIPHDASGLDDSIAFTPEQLERARVLVIEGAQIDAAVLDNAPVLELVVACRSNPVTVDVEACERRGIRVATTPARNADVTADMAFALLLSCVRQLSRSERWLRSREWTPETRFFPYKTFRGPSLHGRTLGLVGLGAVGGRVAHRAAGFGMNVVASDPDPAADPALDFVKRYSLHEVLAKADMVSIHAPLMPSTIGLIGRDELALMKQGSYLVNSARAAIVDEAALVEALKSGHLAGAGLDVYMDEPLPPTSELLDLQTLVLTPHIGGASDDVIGNHSRAAMHEISRLIADSTPKP